MSEINHGISWFGAAVVASKLLQLSKEGQEGNESYGHKMARTNFAVRVEAVRDALNLSGGNYDEASQRLQNNFFTDVQPETLAGWLKTAVDNLADLVLFPKEAYGDLDFVAFISHWGKDENEENEDEENEDEDEENE